MTCMVQNQVINHAALFCLIKNSTCRNNLQDWQILIAKQGDHDHCQASSCPLVYEGNTYQNWNSKINKNSNPTYCPTKCFSVGFQECPVLIWPLFCANTVPRPTNSPHSECDSSNSPIQNQASELERARKLPKFPPVLEYVIIKQKLKKLTFSQNVIKLHHLRLAGLTVPS